jgi:diketogulonate reductase-like aldo/keto reductase
MPVIGFGSIIPEGQETIDAVKSAVKAGYRHFDTAAAYGNERSLGEGLRQAMVENNLKREDFFVTTKAWHTERGYEKTYKAFETSLNKLDIEYVDLYLIHWPANAKWHDDWRELNRETWRALEEHYKAGRIKAIGVANFLSNHLEALIEDAEIKPMVDQIEYHPGFYQDETAKFAQKNDIIVEAWSPLGGVGSHVLDDPTLNELAEKYGKNPAQITLRWLFQKNLVVLPKSLNPDHMIANLDFFDFELTTEDMGTIDVVPYSGGMRFDPDTARS